MRSAVAIATLTVISAIGLAAQGRGGGHKPAAGSSAGAAHSNAPATTPAASADRDKGTDRAADVGKGKHTGLSKKNKGKHKDSGKVNGKQ